MRVNFKNTFFADLTGASVSGNEIMQGNTRVARNIVEYAYVNNNN